MATPLIAKDLPLSELTLRRYEKPSSDASERELVRKLCLSVGLLQPGDSRDVIVDIFLVLLHARQRKEELTSEQVCSLVIESRKTHQLALLGIAHSNVRRQLKRLKDLFLVENNTTTYRIPEFLPLQETFRTNVENFLLGSVMGRVKEYIAKVDEKFG